MATKKLTLTQEQKEKRYNEAIKNLLPWAAPTLPNMANYTPSRLVDEVGVMKELEKDLKKVINTLNGVIDSKMTPTDKLEGNVRGEAYVMKLTQVTQVRLSSDRARAKIIELAKKLKLEPDLEVADCEDIIDMEQHRYDSI